MAKQEKNVFRARDAEKPAAKASGKTVFRAEGSRPQADAGKPAKPASALHPAAPQRSAPAHPQNEKRPPIQRPAAPRQPAGPPVFPASKRTIRRSGQTVVRQAAPQPNKRPAVPSSAKSPCKPQPAAKSAPAAVRPRSGGSPKARAEKHMPIALPIVLLVAVLMLAGAAAFVFWGRGNRPAAPQSESPAASAGWPVQVGGCQVDARPERIVSLSPMLTQAMLSLPGHEALCGVTEYCRTNGEEFPTVGTPLLPRPESIKQLDAQYVLCQTPIPDAAARSIEQEGARIIQLPAAQDMESLRELYAQLGALLLGEETGRSVGNAVIDRLEDSLSRCRAITGGEKTALILPDLSGLAATADTAEWQLLDTVFRHCAPEETGWMAGAAELADEDPENDLEPIRRADPDLLFVPADISPEQLNEKLGGLRAVQEGKVVFYDRQTLENLSPAFVLDVVRGVRLVCPQAFEGNSGPAQPQP